MKKAGESMATEAGGGRSLWRSNTGPMTMMLQCLLQQSPPYNVQGLLKVDPSSPLK